MPADDETRVTQLMESIRKQDEHLHSWTTTLVTVQGGIVAALGVLWATGAVGLRTKTAVTAALAAVAIAACKVCVEAAVSDLQWQGKYIRYVKEVDPVLFKDFDPPGDGVGRQATLYKVWLFRTITAFWLLVVGISVVKWWRG